MPEIVKLINVFSFFFFFFFFFLATQLERVIPSSSSHALLRCPRHARGWADQQRSSYLHPSFSFSCEPNWSEVPEIVKLILINVSVTTQVEIVKS